MWVTKLLISPVKIRIFCLKKSKFGLKMAFLFILVQALPAYLVGGCGARAVSRKTPIYFIDNFHFSVSTFTKGEQMVPVLNRLGVHCAVYGNHDFGLFSIFLFYCFDFAFASVHFML